MHLNGDVAWSGARRVPLSTDRAIRIIRTSSRLCHRHGGYSSRQHVDCNVSSLDKRRSRGLSRKWSLNAHMPTLTEGGKGGGGGGGFSDGDDWGGDGGAPFFLPMFFIGLADSSDHKGRKQQQIMLTLCSFAVSRRAYTNITRMFRKHYKEKTGKEVRFRLSFGGSGVQARAVIDGLPADIVALALPLDIIKIEQAGLINSDWRKRVQNNAIVAESVIAVVVRRGNPKNIQDWGDLIAGDVEVVTSNPKTAGGARWNFLALWGHKMHKGKSRALDFVTEVFRRVPVQPRDSREASDVFYKQKVGDALLNYENEVRLTNDIVGSENALPYVVPKKNIRVDAPVAIIDRNIDRHSPEVREAAEAFIEFLFTPEAQREFVKCGFRSVIPSVAKETAADFPKVGKLWNVEKKLGGWLKTQETFFDSGKLLDQLQKVVAEERRYGTAPA